MIQQTTKDRLFEHYSIQPFNAKEFKKDVNRIVVVIRTIDKWLENGECDYRLLLNHVIIIKNLFGDAGLYALYEYADNFKYPIPAIAAVCYYLDYISKPAIYDLELYNKITEAEQNRS